MYAFGFSTYIVNLEQIYFFNQRHYSFIEHMDRGNIFSIIKNGQEFLSEKFIKRTIRCAVMALNVMHDY